MSNLRGKVRSEEQREEIYNLKLQHQEIKFSSTLGKQRLITVKKWQPAIITLRSYF